MAFASHGILWLARWAVGVGREVRRLAGAGTPVPLPWGARTLAMSCAHSDRRIATITTERTQRVPPQRLPAFPLEAAAPGASPVAGSSLFVIRSTEDR